MLAFFKVSSLYELVNVIQFYQLEVSTVARVALSVYFRDENIK